MKMVKSNKLKSEVIKVEGKEVIYILLDEAIEAEVKQGIVSIETKGELKLQDEMNLLSKEVKLLRAEIEALKKKI